MGGTELKRFAVALLFPGEWRSFVKEVAEVLATTLSPDRILYDKYHEAEFARLDLDVYLPRLYSEQSELIVVFLCTEYDRKRWSLLEWRGIRQIIATTDPSRIMPVCFSEPGDLGALGIYSGDGRFEAGERTPDEVARAMLSRLRSSTGSAADYRLSLPKLPEPKSGSVPRAWNIQPTTETFEPSPPPTVSSLEPLDDTGCVIAIGEPGIGKSTAMRAEFAAARQRADNDSQHFVVGVDLRTYADERRLIEDVFASAWWRAWAAGTAKLTLYLDSLDECRLGTPLLTDLLTDQLETQRKALGRLRLRVACRTADLPRQIRDVWRKDLFKEHGYCTARVPLLTDNEAETILRQAGLDPATVLSRVKDLNATELLRRPVTLELLIHGFRGALPPTSLSDLYTQGCRALASESNTARADRQAAQPGTPDGPQLLALDTQAAALVVFANLTAIDDHSPNLSHDDLPIDDWATGNEFGPPRVTASLANTRAALKMALFAQPKLHEPRYEFAHRTYAEFLASRHPNRAALRSLLFMEGTDRNRVVPQLAEVAAWLAGIDDDFRKAVLDTEPDVLLRSDVVRSDDGMKVQVAQALLDAVEQKRLSWTQAHELNGGEVLRCDGTAAVVQHAMMDSARSVPTRMVAVKLARDCDFKQAKDSFYALALSPEIVLGLRIAAAGTIARLELGDSRLRGLAEGVKEDKEDELKGCALRALWRSGDIRDNIFEFLDVPKEESLFGAYKGFLYELERELPTDLLPSALAWARDRRGHSYGYGPLVDLCDSIVRAAWRNIGSENVVGGLADLALVWAKDHESILPRPSGSWSAGGEQKELDRPTFAERREVIQVLLSRGNVTDASWRAFVFSREPLMLAEDVEWLLTLADSLTDVQKGPWASLTMTLATSVAGACEFIAEHYGQLLADPSLHYAFGPFLDPIPLHGDAANGMRAREAEFMRAQAEQEAAKRKRANQSLTLDPKVRVLDWLERGEQDPKDGWWKVWLQLTLTPGATQYGSPLRTMVTAMPGWHDATQETRERLISLAEAYLDTGDPDLKSWLGKSAVHHPAAAGYAAFGLLHSVAPARFAVIGSDLWEKWAGTITAVAVDGTDEHTLQADLVKAAYGYAPKAILETLKTLLVTESTELKFVFSQRVVAQCWDDRLAGFFRELLFGSDLIPEAKAPIVELLLAHGDKESLAWACEAVNAGGNAIPDALRPVLATEVLLASPDVAWPQLAPVLTADTEIARKVFHSLGRRGGYAGAWPRTLDLRRDGEILALMFRLFPAEGSRRRGAGVVGPEEGAAMLRDQLLNRVIALGTQAAADELAALASATGLAWLAERALEVTAVAARRAWTPLKPSELLDLLGGRND